MSQEFSVPEIAKREEKFFNGKLADFSRIEVQHYFAELQGLVETMEADVQKLRGTSREQVLKTVFSRVYDFVIAHNDVTNSTDCNIFGSDKDTYDDVFEVCFFMSLCMFLYDTKRVKGMSLREFIYKHSPQKYNVKESPNYFDFNNRPREFCEGNSDRPENSSNLILSEDTALRQYRKRLLNKRTVYQHSSEWSAIRKVSEHEWELYFALDEANVEIKETAKRIRNLYNDVYRAFDSKMDGEYLKRLDMGKDKFYSKVKKIQYSSFLDLGKFFLSHIITDKTCYGMNLYRFEKQLGLYAVTGEVRRLLNCKTTKEENDVLMKSVILKDIPFPKLCKYFGNSEDIMQIDIYVRIFCSFMDDLVRSSRLVIDKFVEEGTFGEDWENLFLDITNKSAESVLYDPKVIDYSMELRSQEMFQKDISAPVEAQIVHMTKLWKYISTHRIQKLI